MRTGYGMDVHALDGEPPLLLCGVLVSSTQGLSGTSDADVAAHAVADALLGAAVLGDLGTLFPSSEERWHGADSMQLLGDVVARVQAAGWRPIHADLTVISQSIRIAPHREEMQSRLASALGLEAGAVSVKATTTDGLGAIGRDEGIAAVAMVTVTQAE